MTQHREGEGKQYEIIQKLAMEGLTEQEVFKEHSRCRIQNELLTGKKKKKGRCKNSQETTEQCWDKEMIITWSWIWKAVEMEMWIILRDT